MMMQSTCLQLCSVLLLVLYQLPAPTLSAVILHSLQAVRSMGALGKVLAASSHVLQRHSHATTSTSGGSESMDVGECILLFGGNMGDMAQAMAMEHLLASVAPPNQCFWYVHPWGEVRAAPGKYTAELSSGNVSRLIPLADDRFEEMNRFKALVVAGGGILSARQKHAPSDIERLLACLTLPIIAMSVAASPKAEPRSAVLLRKAIFVSGRDAASTRALSSMLLKINGPVVKPDDVALVRDPVLSDNTLTDTEGTCWKQSEGEHQQPVCFVLPGSSTQLALKMHRQLVAHVVRPGDIFVNVIYEQQKAVEQYGYPGEVLCILDWAEFMERLCSCRAIVSTRFHGAILGLHMGVPTLGAFCSKLQRNEVRELMIDTMNLPEQYLGINEELTRETLDLQVETARKLYADQNHRASIYARLSAFSEDFRYHAHHVLFDILGLQEKPQQKKQHNQWQAQMFFSITPGSEKETISINVPSPPTVMEHLSFSSVLPPADEVAKVITTLGAVPGESLNALVDRRVRSFEAVVLSYEDAFKPSWEAVTEPTRREDKDVSEIEALTSHRGSVGTPAAAAETIEEIFEATKQENEKQVGRNLAPETELTVSNAKLSSMLEVVDAAGNNVPMMVNSRSPLVDTVEGIFNNDHVAAILLLVVIVGLALLPPRCAPRRPSNGILFPTQARWVGKDDVLMEIGSNTSSDSEVNVVSEWRAAPPIDATNRATCPSSMIFFMLNFIMWASLAKGFSGYRKAYLSGTHNAVGLLALQGVTGVAILCLLGHFVGLDLHPGKDLTLAAARQVGLAALLHAAHALLTNFAVLVGDAATMNALKAAEPVATAVFSYLLLGKTFSGPRMAALGTIVVGIALLTPKGTNTYSDGDYILVSAVIGMAAVCFNSLRNVYVKKGNPTAPPNQILLAYSVVTTVFGVGLTLLTLMWGTMDDILQGAGAGSAEGPRGSGGGDGNNNSRDSAIGWLRMNGVNAALCFVGYNLASFNLLVRLSPVGHAVGNSCKRMLVLASELLLLGEAVTLRKLGGAAVALFGVLAYNMAGTSYTRPPVVVGC